MKSFAAEIAYFIRRPAARRNLRGLLNFLLVLLAMMVVFTAIFHVLARAEGQEHSLVSGLYWTVVTMTTLGYGDIAFQGDAGRFFSMVVILSGSLFLLVLLPFTFIQFFYEPWIEAREQARAPRKLSEDTRNHVILTSEDPVASSLKERLSAFGRDYVILERDLQHALELSDEGIRVMVGDPDDPETYRRARVDRAELVVASGDDYWNTNIVSTVREVSESVPIVSLVRNDESADILELAGATHVVNLAGMLGRSLARRTLGGDLRASVIGEFHGVKIAEAPVTGTPLVGKTIRESRVREMTGANIVGIWERGRFELPRPETPIEETTVLVMAGRDEQLQRFDELICIYNISESPVLILGGGRVGRAVADALAERDVPYRIVEKDPARIRDPELYVEGSAAELDVLKRAGIDEAPSTLVTTNDDATNIYLTIYCRRLRPDMQIISRATLERNIPTLHRAGADFVMSYASMGANAIYNVMERDEVLMLAEGIDVFRFHMPEKLKGVALVDSRIRETTGCSVVAVEREGETFINPPPDHVLQPDEELILIGTPEGERKFIKSYEG
jgi:voltage-gated potassium channel